MSEKDFYEWRDLCAPLGWEEPQNRDSTYPESRHLPYCNALNGVKYNPDTSAPRKIESRPIRTIQDWKVKRDQIRDTLEMLRPDIVAVQEITNQDALEEILDSDEYQFYTSDYGGVRQQLGFAVRKKLIGDSVNSVSYELFEELAVKAPDGHKVRPGLVLNFTVYGREVSMLNLHLKASCAFHPIGVIEPDDEQRRIDGCKTLAEQIPVLEKWIEEQSTKRSIVLGDFNRSRSNDYQILSARLDGTNASDPHEKDTIYASLFREISDGAPKLGDLLLFSTANYSGASGCRIGIDHFAVNEYFIQSENFERRYLNGAVFPFSNGLSPVTNEIKTSDHCPVAVRLKITKPPASTEVNWMDIPNKINVSDYRGQPLSSWLYGYQKSIPNIQKISKQSCETTQYKNTLACKLLVEQKREFSLPSDLHKLMQNLSSYFAGKVQRVVSGEHLTRYFVFLSNKGMLTTERLEDSDLRYVPDETLSEYDNPSGKYIRPHIIQATAGIGVTVILNENSHIYNVGYIFGERTPGRSYSIDSGSTANDISYDELFEKLEKYLITSNQVEVEAFYNALFQILSSSSTDGLSTVSAQGRSILIDIVAVYLAEGFRYHTGGSSEFHDDLITVVMLAPWALTQRVVVTEQGVKPMEQKEGLKGFIVKKGNSSGLGFAREQRASVQKHICTELASRNPDNENLINSLSKRTNSDDCIYGVANFLRAPKIEDAVDDRLIKIHKWITEVIPNININP